MSEVIRHIHQMDTEAEEKYVSMRLAHGDISNVVDLLKRARMDSDTSIKSAVVRYCIIMRSIQKFRSSP
jgi:hypothetical protein